MGVKTEISGRLETKADSHDRQDRVIQKTDGRPFGGTEGQLSEGKVEGSQGRREGLRECACQAIPMRRAQDSLSAVERTLTAATR
jgi:hypothetical protein